MRVLLGLVLAWAAAASSSAQFPPSTFRRQPPSVLVSASNLEESLAEFLLGDCNSSPWIAVCKENVRYISLVDQKGNFLQEKTSDLGGGTEERVVLARRRHFRLPEGKEIARMTSIPNFVFKLVPWGRNGAFYVQSSSGRLLSSSDDAKLVFIEDICTNRSFNALSTTTPAPLGPSDEKILADAACARGDEEACASGESDEDGGEEEKPLEEVCDAALWLLDKDGIFLKITSFMDARMGLKVEGDKLILSGAGHEMFTGVNTNFITNVRLAKGGLYRERADEYPEGLAEDARGDITVEFVDRTGAPKQGSVCDYGWSAEDANAVCKGLGHQAGLPTYNGHFTNDSASGVVDPRSMAGDDHFAVSDVRCRSTSHRLQDCDIRTVRPRLNHLVQKSMDGIVHLCQPKDRAGVICGRSNLVIKLKKGATDCGSVGRTVSDMFSIKSQIEKVTAEMNANKHWSEYVLPIPSTVSLLSSVMLQSTHVNMTIRLAKAQGGTYQHLRWNTYRANLAQFAFSATHSFKLSNKNMNGIKANSKVIHKYLLESVKNAFSADPFEHKTLLTMHLNEVSMAANSSYDNAVEVVEAFEKTRMILDELVEAVVATQEGHGLQVDELRQQLHILRNESETFKKEIEQKKKEKTEFFQKIESSMSAFHNAAKKAINEECVNGTIVCNKCVYKAQKKLGNCLVSKVPVCTKYEDKCSGSRPSFSFMGISAGSKCASYNSQCVKTELQCPQFEYRKAGRYCEDPGMRGPLCLTCNHAQAVQDTVSKVFQLAADLHSTEPSSLDFGIVQKQVNQIMKVLNGIVVAADSASEQREEEEILASITGEPTQPNDLPQNPVPVMTGQNPRVSRGTGPQGNRRWQQQQGQLQHQQRQRQHQQQGQQQQQPIVPHEPQERDIESRIEMLHAQTKLLNEVLSIDPAKTQALRLWSRNLQSIASRLKTSGVQLASELTPQELESLRESLDEVQELNDQLLVKARETEARTKNQEKRDGVDFTETGVPLPVVKEARALVENERSYAKVTHRLENVEAQLRTGMMEILSKNVIDMDLVQVLKFLEEMAEHMSFMQRNWGQISLFFEKIALLLENSKSNVRRMIGYYRQLQVHRRLMAQEAGSYFMQLIQDTTIQAMAYNTYTHRLATFYTKLAETGLIEKLDSIGENLVRVPDRAALARYKSYITRHADATQARIRADVNAERQSISEKMFFNVVAIKRAIVCTLEEKQEELKRLEASRVEESRVRQVQAQVAQMTHGIVQMEEDENELNNTVEMLGTGDTNRIRRSAAAAGVHIEAEESLPRTEPFQEEEPEEDAWGLDDMFA